MRYYFAASFPRHEELRAYRNELQAAISGAEVVSRWIDLDPTVVGSPATTGLDISMLNADPEKCWTYGQQDLEDLAKSEAIVSFTGIGGRGGRHIEHGIAIAYHQLDGSLEDLVVGERFRLILIGPREHIFHCHPATEVFAAWTDFLKYEVERSRH